MQIGMLRELKRNTKSIFKEKQKLHKICFGLDILREMSTPSGGTMGVS